MIVRVAGFPSLLVMLVILAVISTLGCGAHGGGNAYHPTLDAATFQSKVDNPFFPLVPGTTYTFSERADGEVLENEVAVTSDTKTILGIRCVVVHDMVKREGVLLEDTYDWYAQDAQGNVWYFGEDTKEYRDKGKFSTEGSWEAGVDRAEPGIIMKGAPMVGESYRQEYRRGVAEDMGEVLLLNESVTVPHGSYTGCLVTRDWSLLEAGGEKKWYARGLGFVRSEAENGDRSELISVTGP